MDFEKLKLELLELKATNTQLAADNQRLVAANNRFRSLLFSESQEPNGIFLAQAKNHWALAEPEELLTFLESLEYHCKIVAELVHSKFSKKQLEIQAEKRSKSKIEEAKKYREKKAPESIPSEGFSPTIDKKQWKAVQSMMKAFGVSREVAVKMVEEMNPLRKKS